MHRVMGAGQHRGVQFAAVPALLTASSSGGSFSGVVSAGRGPSAPSLSSAPGRFPLEDKLAMSWVYYTSCDDRRKNA